MPEPLLNFLSVLLMLGILSVLIIVHEFGHFSVARFFGFQTPVFGIGLPFGPSWTVGEKWGTQFRIHALLLGGYVAIPELGDESNLAQEAYGVPLKPFRKFPIWQRALVAVAGVTMNAIFAYFVMLAMVAFIGVPVEKVYVEQLADTISVARDAGVLAGDRIESIDSTRVKTTEQVIDYLTKRKSTEVTLHISREAKQPEGKPAAEAKAELLDIKAKTTKDGKLGMMLTQPIEKIDGSPLELAGRAYTELSDLTVQMVSTLGNMVQSVTHNLFFGWMEKKPAGKPAGPGLGDLHGVVVVIKWGAEIAQNDWTKLFTFSALISMDLALVNLLPIPALDGGHLFFMLLEAIRGKPMDEKLQSELVRWGFIGLIALMAVIMVNDVRALFTGELDFKKHHKGSQSSSPGSQNSPGTGTGTGTDTGTGTGTETGTTGSDSSAKQAPQRTSDSGAATPGPAGSAAKIDPEAAVKNELPAAAGTKN